MNEICRVSAEELSRDHASAQAPDYSPTYPQAVQNRFESLAKDRVWFMNYAEDELVDHCEILQQAALSENERDIQQAGGDFIKSVIKALKNKAKDDVGAPWGEVLHTPRRKVSSLDVNATFDRMFKEQIA